MRRKDIDILKGIGIILVVLGHVKPEMYVEKWIYSFHMFLFFFLCGLVFNRTTLKEQFKKSVLTCLLPYFVWNGIAIIISICLQETTAIEALKNMFFIGKVSWNSPIWFLLVLFWTRIAAQFLTAKKVYIFCALPFLILLGYLCIIPSVLGLDILPMALIWFSLGYILKETKVETGFWKGLILSAILMLVCIITSYINNRISVYGNYYGNYIIALVSGLCGVGSTYIIINLYTGRGRSCAWLESVGKYSLNIMCSHYLLLRFLSYITIILFNYDLWHAVSTFKAVLVTVIVISLEMLSIKILKG